MFNAAERITLAFRSNILAGPSPRERLPLAARSIITNKNTGLYSVLASELLWMPPRTLCVRRERGGQGELKSCTPPESTGGPQATAMRLND
jgi:hypothetical protein